MHVADGAGVAQSMQDSWEPALESFKLSAGDARMQLQSLGSLLPAGRSKQLQGEPHNESLTHRGGASGCTQALGGNGTDVCPHLLAAMHQAG